MSTASRRRTGSRIDALMERASAALSSMRWFEAERLAMDALEQARRGGDFLLMSRICLPLQEARRNRRSEAFDVAEEAGVHVVNAPRESAVGPGVWLVVPPLVGADARRLRLAALERRVTALVLCREPTTRTGRWPVVAAGSVILRTHVDPPPGLEGAPRTAAPPLPWFAAALEALGDAGIASSAGEPDPGRRVDALMACLDAHPDHEKLHQALADACRAAHLSGAARTSHDGAEDD